MDKGAWWATVHGVTRSQAQLSMHVKNDDSLPQKRLLALSLLIVQFMFKHGSLLCFFNFCGFSLFIFKLEIDHYSSTLHTVYVCKSLCSQICIICQLLLYLYFNPYCMVISYKTHLVSFDKNNFLKVKLWLSYKWTMNMYQMFYLTQLMREPVKVKTGSKVTPCTLQ